MIKNISQVWLFQLQSECTHFFPSHYSGKGYSVTNGFDQFSNPDKWF